MPAFDLQALSDRELAQHQLHANEWFVRHSRRILQERAQSGTISEAALSFLRDTLETHPSVPRRLRALWALWTCNAIDPAMLVDLLHDPNEHLRHWSIRLAADHQAPEPAFIQAMVKQAGNEPSALVRLALAAALQRLDASDRFALAGALLKHAADAEDANLPLMIWYGIESAVGTDTTRSLQLMQQCQVPKIRTFIARRLASGAASPAP